MYFRNHYECGIFLNDSALCEDESMDCITPDESYDEVVRKIEEATE